jgi:hypothetical protein
MKSRIPVACLVVFLSASAAAQPRVPAFPGAQGFGADTPAGRGGRIIRVTTLDARGPGSLAQAIEANGPRIVVFEVGGVIDLGKRVLDITEPFLTVAGQTAPSPGVTLIRGGIRIRTHDVLIRHIRVRPGDAGEPPGSGWEPDGISAWGASAYNIVIDHCSVTWAVDENMSASGPIHLGPRRTARDLTFSNCIIAEGLQHASHGKGPHSKGSLVHDFCSNVAIVGNLYAHNHARCPYFKGHTTGVVVNNVIYNPGVKAVTLGYVEAEYERLAAAPSNARVAVVGNIMLHGPDTVPGLPLVSGRGDVYCEGNLARDPAGNEVAITSGGLNALPVPPVWPNGLEVMSAHQALERVLACAGARPAERDAVDRRIVAEVRGGTGRIIDSQDDVGGYPRVEGTFRRLDIPSVNIDRWLARLADELE